jgi:hypothetical protein
VTNERFGRKLRPKWRGDSKREHFANGAICKCRSEKQPKPAQTQIHDGDAHSLAVPLDVDLHVEVGSRSNSNVLASIFRSRTVGGRVHHPIVLS